MLTILRRRRDSNRFFGSHVLKHGANIFKLAFQYLGRSLKHFENSSVVDGVIRFVSLLARRNNGGVAQYRKLLGSIGLLNIELLTDLVYREFPVAQAFDDCNPHRMG